MTIFKKAKNYFAVCIAGIAISSFGQSKMTFNVDQATIKVPKEVFGVLMERLGREWSGTGSSGVFVGTTSSIANVNGMRKDVIDAYTECGVGAVEWPGGCAANAYNWSVNKAPANDVGVDRFIQFCKLTGAEPVITGRPQSLDASSNLAFADYIINTLQYPLKWFKVGCEVWGCGGSQTADGYMTSYIANYEKLKALKNTANGKNLNIICAAGGMEGNFTWVNKYLTGTFGASVDALEYHDYIYYPSTINSVNPTTANYWTIMKDVISTDFSSHVLNSLVPAMNTADPSKRIKLAIDEYGDWLMNTGDGWMQQNTVMDAVSAGLHLNIMLGQTDRMGLACMSMGVNVLQSLININTSQVLAKTPTFYVFKLLKPHHNNSAKQIPCTVKTIENVTANGVTIPVMNAAASVDASGIVNISFTNTDLSNTRKVTVTLTSSKRSYSVKSAEVVTGTAHTSTNNFGAAEQVNIKTLSSSNYSISGKTLTVTLPTKSVVMIRLTPQTAPGGGATEIQSTGLNNRPETITAKAGAKGSVLISSVLTSEKTVTIGLYRADGRTLVKNTNVVLQRGNGNVDLKTNSNGVYFVKITGHDVNMSERIVLKR